MSFAFSFRPCGDNAFLAKAGDGISPEINAAVIALCDAIEADPPPGLVELVPAYNELLVCYDPITLSWRDFLAALKDRARLVVASESTSIPSGKPSLESRRRVEIPVIYGGEEGPDLGDLAGYCGLTEEEVVQIHSGRDYLVYMLGFLPGFCYLGGLDDRIACPRLDSPRTRVPAGSVGIAERQTGIYPLDSPGGWRIIGRSPIRLFDPMREPPFLVSAGDNIRFSPLEKRRL